MSSDEGLRVPNKTWENTSYIMDPYMGMVHFQGGGSRKTGDDARADPGSPDASLLPKRSRKSVRPAACQIDGCGRDLAAEKPYLQRYSVCEQHFKADVAILHGQEVRFCQQCNKFQELREFEGVRRSCAARSKDRNLRRRLQTSLQRGVATDDMVLPMLAGTQQLQQQQRGQDQQGVPGSGSQERSGGDGAGAGGPSDDSGGRAGSGDASMGGSAAIARRPGRSGGSEGQSLDARAAALTGMVAVPEGRLGAPGAAGGFRSRTLVHPTHVQRVQPSGSSVNPGGASSADLDLGSHGTRAALGGLGSKEQVAQSYEGEGRLAAVQAAAANRRMLAAAAAVSHGPLVDGLLGASGGNAYHYSHRHGQQQSVELNGNPEGPGGLEQAMQQDLSLARKLAAAGGANGGSLGWGPPAALSLLEGLEGLSQPAHQQLQQPSLLSLQPSSGLQLQQGQASLAGSWLPGAEQQRQVEQQQQACQNHQLQEAAAPTLAGVSDDDSAAALLGQLQAALSSRGRGSPTHLGYSRGGEADMHAFGEALERTRRPTPLQLQPAQALGHSQTLGPPSASSAGQHQQQPDNLLAMVRERRAALIRQQLLRQQHGQQQLHLLQHHPRQQLQTQHLQHLQQQHQYLQQQPHQQQDVLAQQEQLALLGGYGEGNFLGLTASEQLQLRLIAAGASAGASVGVSAGTAGGLDNALDCSLGSGNAARGGMLAMDFRGGGLGAKLAGSRISSVAVAAAGSTAAAAGGTASLSAGETLGLVGGQPRTLDPNFEAIQLLEQYALGGGGGAAGASRVMGRLDCAGEDANAAGGLAGSLGPVLGGGGARSCGEQGLGSAGNPVGLGEGVGGGCESGDVGARLSMRGGSGERGAGSGSGGSQLLSGLFPGAGGLEDGLAARVCLKIFDCTPDYLPRDLLLRLRRWASVAESDVMQIFMRPGCVHVVVNVRLGYGGQAAVERSVLGDGDLDAAVAALRGAFDSCGLLRGRRVVAQAAERFKGAFEYDGTAGGQARWVAPEDFARAPSVESFWPAAMPCGTPTVAVLSGRNLLRPETRYYARCGGRTFELLPLVPQPAAAAIVSSTPAGLGCDYSPEHTDVVELAAAERQEEAEAQHTLVAPGVDAPTPTDSPPLLASPIHTSSLSPVASSHQLGQSWASPESGPTPEASPVSMRPSAAAQGPEGAGAQPGPLAQRPLQLGQQGPHQPAWRHADAAPLEHVYVHMPGLPLHGLLAVEATHPDVDVMGGWGAGLACQDPLAVAELNAWLRRSADRFSARFLLSELGLLLDYDSMLPSLLHDSGGAALRAGEGVAAAAATAAVSFPQQGSPAAAAGAGARSGPLAAVQPVLQPQQPQLFRPQEQLDYPPRPATQPQGQQQQQQGRPRLLGAIASNPAPRPAHPSVLPAGALSAVSLSREDSPSLLVMRPDGTMELRLLPSSSSDRAAVGGDGSDVSGGEATGARDPARRSAPAADSSDSRPVTPQAAATARWPRHGSGGEAFPAAPSARLGVGVGVGLPVLASGDAAEAGRREAQEVHEALLSDDTRVPDAAGRLLQPSLRRLLAHPLLNPACRRTMQYAAARLLAYSVVAGLPHLANGLLEWLVNLEAPALGVVGGGPAPVTSGVEAETSPSAAAMDTGVLFNRVVRRAAATTALAVARAAGGGEDPGDDLGHNGPGAPAGSYGVSRRTGGSSVSISSSSSSLGCRCRFRDLGSGLGLLALAVASGSSEMVLQVLEWGDVYGKAWSPDEQFGTTRVTALHLAAALRDGGDIARLLLSLGASAAEEAWLLLRDARGRTPAEIAAAQGLTHLNYLCIYGEVPPEAGVAAAAPLAANLAAAGGAATAPAAGLPSGLTPMADAGRRPRCLGDCSAEALAGAAPSCALSGRAPAGDGRIQLKRLGTVTAVVVALFAMLVGLWARSIAGRGS